MTREETQRTIDKVRLEYQAITTVYDDKYAEMLAIRDEKERTYERLNHLLELRDSMEKVDT